MDNKGADFTDSSTGGAVKHDGNKNVEELAVEKRFNRKKPSKMYMVLLTILVLVAIAVIITLVVIALENNELAKKAEELKSAKPSKPKMCTSKQCIKSAATYLDSMDQDVDPCDNFYDYACGGWLKQHVIPEDKRRLGAFTILNEMIDAILKELFEREGKPSESNAITSGRNLYKSCLDVDGINGRNAQPLVDLLVAVGGWPVLGNSSGGNWDPTTFYFERFWALLNGGYGAEMMASLEVEPDEKNSTINILKIDQPIFESRDYTDKQKAAYLQYMVDVIVELGGDEATAMSQMTDVLELETALANMTVPGSERRDEELLYNPYTLEELNQVYSQINWTLYLDLIMPAKVKPILPTERIIVRSPVYLERLNEWLPRQDKRVIANYMVWRLVSGKVSDLGKAFNDILQRFLKVIQGTSSAPARWVLCVDKTRDALPFGVGRMYVDENFPAIAKKRTIEMISNLKTAFKAMLKTNDWLQEADKKVAAEKIDKMQIDVGYPDWILDDDKLDEEYEGLNFVADNLFENSVRYGQWIRIQGLAALREPVKRVWPLGPASANAWFVAQQNRIIFFAGILQPPFFHHELPWYSNVGGIGMVIGHEITHGFDDRGRQFDADGNLMDWWSAESVVKFNERKQCIVDQYGAFVAPETNENLNGVQTQGENIADNGGLKEAYKAYIDNVSEEPGLPGLELNGDQMFFLSFAQLWCGAYRPELVTSRILTGRHSLPRFRVIGPLQNNEDFTKAFNCPSTSYMNPADKCNVW